MIFKNTSVNRKQDTTDHWRTEWFEEGRNSGVYMYVGYFRKCRQHIMLGPETRKKEHRPTSWPEGGGVIHTNR